MLVTLSGITRSPFNFSGALITFVFSLSYNTPSKDENAGLSFDTVKFVEICKR